MAKSAAAKSSALKKNDPAKGSAVARTSSMEKPQLEWTSVEQMRPTQCSVGYIEVELKMRELGERAKDPKALARYLKGHPIPAVMGPDERMYLTDHHHMGLAMCKLSDEWDASPRGAGRNPFRKCCFQIQHDYSDKPDLSLSDFFKKMEGHGLCHPYDGRGERTGQPPKSLLMLEDDPYRSLAGLARKAGAYDKVALPYTEFKWADFLRSRIKVGAIKTATLPEVIVRAVELARSEAAKGLPGYRGKEHHGETPTVEQVGERIKVRHGAADEE